MPTIVTHVATAIPVSLMACKNTINKKIIALSVFMALAPDLDGIGYALGVPYESIFGHRGFSHSIVFVALLAYLLSSLLKNRKQIKQKVLFLNFFTIGVLHILFDAMTNGGLGVALLSPFSNTRFFLPWTPIEVSAILPQYFFGLNGWMVIRFEFLYLILPSIIVSVLAIYLNKKESELAKEGA